MKVQLFSNWFSPAAELLEKGTHEVPDSWKEKLPSKTKVIEPEVKAEAAKAADAEAAAQAEAKAPAAAPTK